MLKQHPTSGQVGLLLLLAATIFACAPKKPADDGLASALPLADRPAEAPVTDTALDQRIEAEFNRKEPVTSDAGEAAPIAAGAAMALLKTGLTEVTETFGSSPIAKCRLGANLEVEFLIPEGALRTATKITFADTLRKGKTNGALLTGGVYRLTGIVAPSTEPVVLTSQGAPFQLALPTNGSKKANLAVGMIGQDERGRELITWKVIAPTSMDAAAGIARFELKEVPDSYLHLTSAKAP